MLYTYVIDEADLIRTVSDNWLSFAARNGAAESCHPDRVINRPIWHFIHGYETRQFYQLIFEAVRTKGKTVTLPYRCDAPDLRRYLELRIAPDANKHIAFASRIVREEPRETVHLLEAGTDGDDTHRIVKICSMCKKVELRDGSWAEVEVALVALRLFEEPQLPSLSHGICSECFRLMMAEVDEVTG